MHTTGYDKDRERSTNVMPQPKTPTLKGAEGMTSDAFTPINKDTAEKWDVPAEVNRAFGELGRPLQAGASSSIKSTGKVSVPLVEGGKKTT